MQRRLAKAIPSPQSYKIKINPNNAGHKGIDEETKILRRKNKTAARLEQPDRFEPDVEKTFPGIAAVPKEILEESFKLRGYDIYIPIYTHT